MKMPRFYFHIRDNGRLVPDEEGMELADLTSALAEAKASALAMRAEARLNADSVEHQVIEITDEYGSVVAEIGLTD